MCLINITKYLYFLNYYNLPEIINSWVEPKEENKVEMEYIAV